MAEYYEREAVIKFIRSYRHSTDVAFHMEEHLNEIPAADVRPVVFCKDCKYFSEVMYKGTQFEYGYCDRWADGTRMNPEDFCSHAAKREES